MNYQIDTFVEQVMSFLDIDAKTRHRLSEDLHAHILDAAGDYASDRDIDDIIARMGEPKDLAIELMDMLYADKQSVVRKLVEAKAQLHAGQYYEYRSKRAFCGLPLVHIHLSRGRYGGMGWRVRRHPAVAKGIIAIGDVSIGVVSIGGISLGGLCFGGIALGLLSFGGIGIGLLIGLGGVGIGAFAMGGLAMGQYAFGGCALATRIAVGGFAQGTVAIGGVAKGLHTLSTGGSSLNTDLVPKEAVRALIQEAYPNLWRPLVDLFSLPFTK